MAVLDLFSKRQRRIRGDVPDVYTYDDLPATLRTQVVHIWLECLGNPDHHYLEERQFGAYKFLVDSLCREYGVFRLPGARDYGDREYIEELVNYFLNESNIERVLDVVELSFRLIDRVTRDWSFGAGEKTDAAIRELNERFREHAVGYEYVGGELLRIDSELLHAEVVKPALRLLSARDYSGAQQEFLAAHEHYRSGNSKEALNECLKAFESTMKVVCHKRRWEHRQNATASELVQVCLDNGLIPAFWQQHFNSLRSLLESSVPTGRNRLGGHGQGVNPVDVPEHLVAYMLHMTAAAIVFLAEAEAALN